jgi:hypothetical protein
MKGHAAKNFGEDWPGNASGAVIRISQTNYELNV